MTGFEFTLGKGWWIFESKQQISPREDSQNGKSNDTVGD
jgi:hypothetical protein